LSKSRPSRPPRKAKPAKTLVAKRVPDIDAKAFHEFEHDGWQHASDDYHRHFGSLTTQTIGPLLDAVAAALGTSLLDIASGPGYVAAAAKRRGWAPVGIDFSDAMVAMARKLHPDIDFRIGDAEALNFVDAEFDLAVMNFGILHLSQPDVAIREAYRVLRAGGHFTFTAWARPEEVAGFRIALRAIEECGDKSVELPPGPPFFRFSDREECTRVLERSGFADVTVTQLPLVWKLASPAAVFEAFYRGSARTGGLLRAQPPAALAKVRDAIEKSAAQYASSGYLEIPMPALVVSARKA
jgi:SAM-dependent methyltransferase